VGINAISKGTLPSGVKVTNPVPTWGGDEGESVQEAEKRIPEHLRHRDRLVAGEDFHDITWGTPGVDLGRVESLPLFHPEQPKQLSLGVVTVMVIPAKDPRHPLSPVPDALFLRTVCEFLAPRRLITTELHVQGPLYVDVWVSIGIDVKPGRDQGPVREAVRTAIQDFLSPLTGGFEAKGWPLEKTVDPAEIAAAASRVPGVAKISGLLFGDEAGERATPLELAGLELPRLAGLSVVSGAEPVPIADLQGAAASTVTAVNMTPVPVIPATC
jgi:predicted phage baseplate assembly protein